MELPEISIVLLYVYNTCIVFEDDFEFTIEQEQINDLINNVFNQEPNFDVLMLAANILNGKETKYEFLNDRIRAPKL